MDKMSKIFVTYSEYMPKYVGLDINIFSYTFSHKKWANLYFGIGHICAYEEGEGRKGSSLKYSPQSETDRGNLTFQRRKNRIEVCPFPAQEQNGKKWRLTIYKKRRKRRREIGLDRGKEGEYQLSSEFPKKGSKN